MAAAAAQQHASALAQRAGAALSAWAEPRAADLAAAAALAHEALRSGDLPPYAGVPPRVLRTSLETLAAAVALLTLAASGRARAVARDVLDTAAAVVLLVVMLAVLLGVPLGQSRVFSPAARRLVSSPLLLCLWRRAARSHAAVPPQKKPLPKTHAGILYGLYRAGALGAGAALALASGKAA
jgi:hypothetical protein